MILAFTKKLNILLTLFLHTLSFSQNCRVEFLIFIIFLLLLLFLFNKTFLTCDSEFFSGSFGQGKDLQELLLLVLEFSTWTPWLGKGLLESETSLFNSLVIRAVFILLARVCDIDIFLISDNVSVSALTFRQTSNK